MRKYLLLIIFLSLLINSTLFAQEKSSGTPLPGMRGAASNLPDISVIGDIAGKISDDEDDMDRNKILIREIELALQGYLYPEIRADVFLAMHRHGDHIEPEICEGFVSFLRVVEGLSLKVGKMHVDFGKINKVHQHERPYVDQPLVLTSFFGEHGLVGEGASLGYLFPLPFFAQIDLNAWRVAGAHHHHEEEDEEKEESNAHHHEEGEEELKEFGLAEEVYTTRLWTSIPLGEISELEIGASGATGRGSHYVENKNKAKVLGLDLTLKFWPSTYQRLIFQNEIFHLIRNISEEELKKWGFYNYAGYQFNKYWDASVRYDWSENAFPGNEKASIASGIITSSLTETTKLRIQYGYNFESKFHEAFLQLVFGIGPHSHPLQ